MDKYNELFKKISEQNINYHRKDIIKKYLIDNLFAIIALIISIIALFK